MMFSSLCILALKAILSLELRARSTHPTDAGTRSKKIIYFRVATIPQNRESVIVDYFQEIKKNLPIHESFFFSLPT